MSNNVSQKTQVYFSQYLNKVFKSSVEVVYKYELQLQLFLKNSSLLIL